MVYCPKTSILTLLTAGIGSSPQENLWEAKQKQNQVNALVMPLFVNDKKYIIKQ